MSSSSVYNTIKDHLVATWGATYAVRDWEEIEVALQQDVAPWLALEDASGVQTLHSIGSPSANHTGDTGFVIIHTFVPTTGRLSAARAILDAVRDDLQFRTFTQSAAESLRIQTVAPATPGVIHDGLWHSMILTVDFEHRYVVATATE